eukprot:571640-Hanusia_phi.AAC.8
MEGREGKAVQEAGERRGKRAKLSDQVWQEMFWRMARELVLDIHQQNGGTKEEALKDGKLRKAQPNAAHMA